MTATDQEIDTMIKRNRDTLDRRIKGVPVDIEFPQQSTYQLKIEDTAKGVRLTVHVYATGRDEVVTEAFRVYRMAVTEAERLDILVAPMSTGDEKK